VALYLGFGKQRSSSEISQACEKALNLPISRFKVLIAKSAPYIVAGGTWQDLRSVYAVDILELCSLDRMVQENNVL
jgi:hypothetical protein